MNKSTFFIAAAFLVSVLGKSYGQAIPIGSLEDELYRSSQLLGLADSTASLMIRPSRPSLLDSQRHVSGALYPGIFSLLENKSSARSRFELLPLTLTQQYLSNRPYGRNDGALIPARGYQAMLSGGFYAKFGPLSIQLKPEMVIAENRTFKGFPGEYPDEVWFSYYQRHFNRVDLPEQFGNGTYSKLSAGQSNIRITINPVSLGISSENLWWGPGTKNSLLMSNTARGFKHLTLNTSRPIHTFVGSFEAQIIAGRLDSSGFDPPDLARVTDKVYNFEYAYTPKENDWRYLSGIALSYQPRWIPGLFLGFTRAFYVYNKDMQKSISGYLPFLTPLEKSKVGNTADDSRKRDQLTSVFIRWAWIAAKVEVYTEFGRNDHSVTFRDLLLEPEHSAAYTVGFTKILPLTVAGNTHIRANVELSKLSNPAPYLVRTGTPVWYVHYQVLHGYTNKGEVIGAGIGPGSDFQSVDLSWVGKWSLGIQMERTVRNVDFYRLQFGNDPVKHSWIDTDVGIYTHRSFNNMLLSARLETIFTSNYQWMYNSNPSNTKGSLQLTYYFSRQRKKTAN